MIVPSPLHIKHRFSCGCYKASGYVVTIGGSTTGTPDLEFDDEYTALQYIARRSNNEKIATFVWQRDKWERLNEGIAWMFVPEAPEPKKWVVPTALYEAAEAYAKEYEEKQRWPAVEKAFKRVTK